MATWFRNSHRGKWHLLEGRKSACGQLGYNDASAKTKTSRGFRCKACRRKAEQS